MRQIYQVYETADLLNDLHPELEITASELLELEEINWLVTQQPGGGLAEGEIVNDIKQVLGFVVGAALGLLFLPGLGLASVGLQSALIGGAIGYRLVGLFSQPDRPADNQSVADPTARFSGTGQLGQLGQPIPMIYGNRDINPDGGIYRRDPIVIYSRIYTLLGLQYIDRLAILAIGVLGRVNIAGLLLNDQPSNLFSSVDLLVESSSGFYDQAALGIINHYSQAVSVSTNSLVGTVLVGSVRGQASGATRGVGVTAANVVGVTLSGTAGTGGYTAKKTATTDAWDSGFTAASQTIPATLGGYVFALGIGTADPTNPVMRWAIGLSDSTVAATATLTSMTIALEISGLNWAVYQSGVLTASGGVPVATGELEIRIYNSIPVKMVMALIAGSEVWRGQMNTPSATLVPDFCIYSGRLSVANLVVGTQLAATTAGDISQGCGVRFTTTPAFAAKIQLGQIYRDQLVRKELIFVAKDPAGLWVETGVLSSILDFTYNSSLPNNIPGIFNGSKIYSANAFYYTTSKAVTSIEFQIAASVWARSSANAFVTHGQCFTIEIKRPTESSLTEIGRFIVVGDSEKIKSLSISVTNLPLDFYLFNIDPINAELVTGTISSLSPTASASKVNSISLDGQVLAYIAEVDITVTNANALLYMGSAGKATFSTDRGSSIQVTHVNEIVNPFLPLLGSSAFIPGSGTGLKREYFIMGATGNPGVKQLPAAATDPTGQVVSWDSNAIAVPPAVTSGKSRVFIDWSGTVVAKVSGVHTFYFSSLDDGGRLTIDGTVVINSFIVGAPRTVSGTLALVAGRQYSIFVEYFNSGMAGSVYLEWVASGLAKERIPATQFFPGVPDNSVTPTDIVCPTYPGYTIGRTREVASDRLQSVPNESWDIPLGAICRQHLATGTTTTAGTIDEVNLVESVVWPGLIAVGDTCRILGVGQRIITSINLAIANVVTCQQYTGTSLAATAGSHIVTVDSVVKEFLKPGMPVTASNIPTGSFIRTILPGNKIALSDEWGLLKVATGTSTITTGIVYNANVAKVANQIAVIFSMGSTCYFPDVFVDRLINPISGLGNYVDADSFIDYPSIVAARDWCTKNKFFYDAVIGEGSFEDWALEASPSSLLFCTTINGLYGLIIQSDEKPSYLFNDSNVIKYSEPGIPWQQQLTNTVLVRYSNNLGRENQIKIQSAAAARGAVPEVPVTVSTIGVTRKAQAIKVGQVALKSLQLQGRTCSIETDVAIGFYTQIGKIIRTQHREIEYTSESSGFITGVETTTNPRSIASAPVVIDNIHDGLITTIDRHKGRLNPVNSTKILESIVITSSPQSANNTTFTAAQTTFVNEYCLLFPMTGGTPYSSGGQLTLQVPVIDQVVRLSDEVTIVGSSRVTITHRSSRFTDEDLVISSLGSGRYQIIGLQEPILIGDAFAIGIATTIYRRWRVNSIQPNINENTINLGCIAWEPSIMTPTGLVTVDTVSLFPLRTATLTEVASVFGGTAAAWTNVGCNSAPLFKRDGIFQATFIDTGSAGITLEIGKGTGDFSVDDYGLFKNGVTTYQSLLAGVLTTIPIVIPAAGDQVRLSRESDQTLLATLSKDNGLTWSLLFNFGVVPSNDYFCRIHSNVGKMTEIEIR